jgi:hypothetical protein
MIEEAKNSERNGTLARAALAGQPDNLSLAHFQLDIANDMWQGGIVDGNGKPQ